MVKGTVKFFNRTKGFGFITSEEDEKDYFVHYSNVENEAELNDGDSVSFEVEEGDRGPKAVKVQK